MSPIAIERRVLQLVVAAACLVPLTTGGSSILRGVAFLKGVPHPVPIDLDSHYRYLSGIFLGVLVALYSCVPGIEGKGRRFRLLGALIICGGLARLAGVIAGEVPGRGHLVGLGLELLVTPALLLWQARVARRAARAADG